MKFHINAKLCFIFLYGCAFVCQTYAATFTVQQIPNEPEENNVIEDSTKTVVTEKSEEYTSGTVHAVPEEITLDTVSEDKVTTEKSEDYTTSTRPFEVEESNLNTDSPSNIEREVTDAFKIQKVTVESIWRSCSKFRICIDGICTIGDCNDFSWEPMMFNPVTKRCTRSYYPRMNSFFYHRCQNSHNLLGDGYY